MKLRWGVCTMPDMGPFPHKGSKEEKDAHWEKWERTKDSYVYEQSCPNCERAVRLYTQEDDNPEYYTDIYMECPSCLSFVRFRLPVN